MQTLQGPGLERITFLFRDCQQLVSVWFSYSIRHSPEGISSRHSASFLAMDLALFSVG